MKRPGRASKQYILFALDYDKSIFAIRGVLATILWLDPNTHVDYCQVIVDTRKFSGSECYTLNTILDLRQLSLGIGTNLCLADLEV